MGCDIHVYAEFRRKDAKRWDGGEPVFDGWPRINPGRYYRIFGRLTNGEVRCDDDRALGLAPRGVPEGNAGWHVRDDYYLHIDYSGRHTEAEGWCSPEDAERWKRGGSALRGSFTPYTVTSSGGGKPTTTETVGEEHAGKPTRVVGPDWHTASWVTSDEWEAAIRDTPETEEYQAILAALRSLESNGYETRVVFWFDN